MEESRVKVTWEINIEKARCARTAELRGFMIMQRRGTRSAVFKVRENDGCESVVDLSKHRSKGLSLEIALNLAPSSTHFYLMSVADDEASLSETFGPFGLRVERHAFAQRLSQSGRDPQSYYCLDPGPFEIALRAVTP
jgi:hypothetical protein